MPETGRWRVWGAGAPEPRAVGSSARKLAAAPRILVVGSVRGLQGLQQVGRVKRTLWGSVRPRAASAELVVIGRSSGGSDATAAIARLKDDPATAATPVLHADPAEIRCAGCRADVCLSTGSVPGQLARVAEALLELASARARSSGLFAARASLAGGEASRPAP
jgi:hypothetical protein